MRRGTAYYFNSTCELAVANGSFSYMPPLLLREMERDLAVLPWVFAEPDDVVIVPEKPSPHLFERLITAGFELPHFETLTDLEYNEGLDLGALNPWGWSPAAHFFLRTLKEKCTGEFRASPVFEWTEVSRSLYERQTSLNFLSELIRKNCLPGLISGEDTGESIGTISDIESYLQRHLRVVLKAPLSSSGRGIQMIRNGNLNNASRQWLSGVLRQQSYVIAEPLLDRVADLSFQFRVGYQGEIWYLGHTFFETNSNGQYQATLIQPRLGDLFGTDEVQRVQQLIETTAAILTENLSDSVYARNYSGFLGIDALFFRKNDELLIQPCIEINCRMTMGILTVTLAQKLHPASMGKFTIYFGRAGEYQQFVKEMNRLRPLKLENGKLIEGFFSLTEPDEKTKFGAYISLGDAR